MKQNLKKYLVLFVVLTCTMTVKATQWAFVSVSVTDMKKAPDYQSETISQAILGTPVQVAGSEGYWYSIVTPEGYRGWTTKMNIVLVEDSEYEAWKSSTRMIVTDYFQVIRQEPKDDAEVIGDCVMGSVLRFDGYWKEGAAFVEGGPYKVRATEEVLRTGWCAVILPDGRKGYVPGTSVYDFDRWMLSKEDVSGNDIVECAMQFRGFPYLWGGLSPKGFDCSGLVKLCYFMNGIILPRDAREQIKEGITLDIKSFPAGMQAGDLLFFGIPEKGFRAARITHVGIYVSEGSMIHSSLVVRTNSLLPGREDSYTSKKIVGAVRILGGDKDGDGIVKVLHHPWYFDTCEN